MMRSRPVLHICDGRIVVLERELAAAIPAAGRIRLVTAGTAIRGHPGPGLLGVVVALLE
jgi:hypothetical protein